MASTTRIPKVNVLLSGNSRVNDDMRTSYEYDPNKGPGLVAMILKLIE